MKKPKKDRLFTLGERFAKIDELFISALAERMALSVEVAHCKMGNNDQPIIRASTEKRRIAQFVRQAKKKKIDPGFARAFYFLIIAESCRIQIKTKEAGRKRK